MSQYIQKYVIVSVTYIQIIKSHEDHYPHVLYTFLIYNFKIMNVILRY